MALIYGQHAIALNDPVDSKREIVHYGAHQDIDEEKLPRRVQRKELTMNVDGGEQSNPKKFNIIISHVIRS